MLMLLNEGMSMGERFGTAGLTLAVGILLIFAILTLLIGVLYLMRFVVRRIDALRKVKDEREEFGARAAAEPEPAEEADEALVAAITAAVACCLEEEGGAPAPFRIRSIRRRI